MSKSRNRWTFYQEIKARSSFSHRAELVKVKDFDSDVRVELAAS